MALCSQILYKFEASIRISIWQLNTPSCIREMNPAKLGFSAWLIILNSILLMTLIVIILMNTDSVNETFINYPEQVNPSAKISSDSDASATANNNYASILMFLQKNPAKSGKFIEDIKSKFFDTSCNIKSDIDFKSIATMPYGMPFS